MAPVLILINLINEAEHHVLYQYHLVNAADHYTGLIQTETVSNNKFLNSFNLIDLKDEFVVVALFPTQSPPAPFCIDPRFKDPLFYGRNPSAWGLSITNSNKTVIFGTVIPSHLTHQITFFFIF
jgi:glucan 1,3-beta-glucosidase